MATATILNVTSPFVYIINGQTNLVYTQGLPSGILGANSHFYLKRTDNTNGTVYVEAGGALIDGQTTIQLPQQTTYHLYSDGTQYYILGKQ